MNYSFWLQHYCSLSWLLAEVILHCFWAYSSRLATNFRLRFVASNTTPKRVPLSLIPSRGGAYLVKLWLSYMNLVTSKLSSHFRGKEHYYRTSLNCAMFNYSNTPRTQVAMVLLILMFHLHFYKRLFQPCLGDCDHYLIFHECGGRGVLFFSINIYSLHYCTQHSS